jgi:hypothetical protein
MDSNAVITYNQLIKNILAALNEGADEFWRYEAIGLQVITDFQIHHMETTQVFQGTLDINHRIALPADCIRVKAIGYPKNGRLWTITRDDKIYTGESIVNGVLASDSDTLELREHRNNGYGAVGSNKYTFTVDYNTRGIVILGTPDTQVFTISYLSSGISLEQNTLIPAEANMALTSAIIFKSIVFDKKITDAYARRVEAQYKEEVFKLRRFYSTYNVDEWHDMILRNQSQVITR